MEGTDIEVIAEATSGEEAFRMTQTHSPDVVLLDIRMPEGDGMTALGRLKLELPSIAVLMLSTYNNPTYIARAVALGANGFLLKGACRDEILAAIRTVASGEKPE